MNDHTDVDDSLRPPVREAEPADAGQRELAPASSAGAARRNVARSLSGRYSIIVIWLAMYGLYAVLMPGTFLHPAVITAIFSSQGSLEFLGLGAMITLAVGEFDMSIASTLGLSATIVPVLVTMHGTSVALACVIAIAASAAIGLINGLIVVRIGVSSLIVTLGNATLLLGVASLISNQTTVSGLSPGLANVVGYPILGLPATFYAGLLLAIFLAYLLGATPLGRHMIFVGANADVARLAGVRVDRIRMGAFIAGATVAGVGGVLLVAAEGGFDPTASPSYLLPTFASVFLGTAVIIPGRFNPIGTLVGVYFMSTGILGLQLLGYNGWVQNVFYGAALVIAVSLATIVRRRSAT